MNGVGRETGRRFEKEVEKRVWKWKKGRRLETWKSVSVRMSAIEKREKEKEG